MNDRKDTREGNVCDDQRDVTGGAAVLHGNYVPRLEVVQPYRIFPRSDFDRSSEYLSQVYLQFSVDRIVRIGGQFPAVLKSVSERAHAINSVKVSTLMNERNPRSREFPHSLNHVVFVILHSEI